MNAVNGHPALVRMWDKHERGFRFTLFAARLLRLRDE